MSKDHMREAEKVRPGCTRRLARFLRMRNLDQMSDRQVLRLLDWYFKRKEKKARGMTWGW
jgi:hypothetical protein